MNDGKENHLYWHAPSVTVDDRREKYDYKSCVLWFTGLSASGKSTLANALNKKFHDMGVKSYVLDGDNVRHGLNKDLGFTEADRVENIRRIGEVAKLMTDAGLIVITAFISPFRTERDLARAMVPEADFIEVFVDTPLEVCEQRDPKGLYKKARAGQIPNFTGINSPYEAPLQPELVIDAGRRFAGNLRMPDEHVFGHAFPPVSGRGGVPSGASRRSHAWANTGQSRMRATSSTGSPSRM